MLQDVVNFFGAKFEVLLDPFIQMFSLLRLLGFREAVASETVDLPWLWFLNAESTHFGGGRILAEEGVPR